MIKIKTILKKSVSTFLLILSLCVLVPSIAPQKAEALSYSQPDILQLINAYNGRGSKYMVGVDSLRAVINAFGAVDWPTNRWKINKAPNQLTGYVFVHSGGLHLNYTRTVSYGIYNNATMYYYETNLYGNDQRVSFVSAGSSGAYYIRLTVRPNESHNYGKDVYLMCDRSEPSTITDVIWYTDTSKDRAIWK